MMRRRDLLRCGLSVFGAALPLASNGQDALSRFRGVTLRIHYPAHPHYERVEKRFARFTALTGIRIESLRAPYLDLKARQIESFAKPTGDFDLVSYLLLWKTEYVQNRYLLPLAPFFANPQLADRNFDLTDLIGPYVDAIGRVEGAPGRAGEIYGLPCGAETSVLVARRDLLAKHGLTMPSQYDELLAACRTLHQKERIGGMATRGQPGHHITHAWLLHLSPHGGSVLNAQWEATLDQKGGVRAVEVLREIAAMAPEGVATAGFSEMQDHFLQGRAAFYLDSSSILGLVRDTKRTRLADRFAYAMHPSGTRMSGETGGFGLGIAANSAHPEAAFMFLQWLTSASTDLAMALDGGVAARWSTLAHPEFRASRPEQSIMRFAVRIANPNWRPLIPEWDRISQSLIGKALPDLVYGNRPIATGLTDLCSEVNAELVRSGRNVPSTSKPRADQHRGFSRFPVRRAG